MKREHLFSPDRKYRYALWRRFEQPYEMLTEYSPTTMRDGYVMFIGLNPSTADENKDDPTLRRCIDFAKRWGYCELCMTNLFGFRATQPRDMLKTANPIGADNDITLLRVAKEAAMILCAWGGEGKFGGRDEVVADMLTRPYAGQKDLMALRLISDGSPEHPLYIPAETKPIIWRSYKPILV